MSQMQALFGQIRQGFRDSAKRADSAAYATLAGAMSELQELLREHIQAKTSAAVRTIIGKLRRSAVLTSEEREIVKLWIVGAAEGYTTRENNVQDWMVELQRLGGEFGRLDATHLEAAQAFYAKALLMDAIRVAWDLHHYLEQKERVGQFLEATKELDAEERQVLARILEDKLSSQEL